MRIYSNPNHLKNETSLSDFPMNTIASLTYPSFRLRILKSFR